MFDNSQYTGKDGFKEELLNTLNEFQIRRSSPSIKTIQEEKSSNEHSKAITGEVSNVISLQ